VKDPPFLFFGERERERERLLREKCGVLM